MASTAAEEKMLRVLEAAARKRGVPFNPEQQGQQAVKEFQQQAQEVMRINKGVLTEADIVRVALTGTFQFSGAVKPVILGRVVTNPTGAPDWNSALGGTGKGGSMDLDDKAMQRILGAIEGATLGQNAVDASAASRSTTPTPFKIEPQPDPDD